MFITSSALAYIPISLYPVYAPSKAAIHALCVVLRQQLMHAPEAVKRNLSIVEIVPPYTDTELDKEHRATSIALQGGPEKALKPMPLDEFIEQAWAGLLKADEERRPTKEVAVGFGQVGVDTWREGVGKILEGMGLDC